MLSDEELERYARHIVLKDVGGAGQQALSRASVLVIGAGGLGSPVIQYLAAAGIGTIGVADNDTVALSNLQRQTIHDTANIGMAKTQSAAIAATRINPLVEIRQHQTRVTAQNALELISCYDIVADGSDNFATRYLIADCCEQAKRILVSAAVGQFDGSITTLKPHCRDQDGNYFPRYRDLFPNPADERLIPTCAQAGILGALTGVVGSMQGLEIIKELLGIGDSLAGTLLMYDARGTRFMRVAYRRTEPALKAPRA